VSIAEITVNVDDKLSLNRFNVDEENAHIKIREGVKTTNPEYLKLVMCCPAALYKLPKDGTDEPIFDYAGCLECGTCRMICGQTILQKWEYPRFGSGVQYREG
jgi:ferredoxin-like protein FixX